MITLYHNPQSRAAVAHWMLEELGIPYTLHRVNYDDGSMRTPEFLELNPMGKIPVLTDGSQVLTEIIAIGIYLADRYKTPKDLAPAIDDPMRGDYLRWIAFYACVEAAMTQASGQFEVPRAQAAWGSHELVVSVLDQRVAKAAPWLLGERFTMADVVLGSGVCWGLRFQAFDPKPALVSYAERLGARPAFQTVMKAEAEG